MLKGLTILPSGKAKFRGNVCTMAKNKEKTQFEIKKRDQKKFPTVLKEDIQKVIWESEPCQMIDPTPAAWTHGKLEVNENWKRLGMDITHYRG